MREISLTLEHVSAMRARQLALLADAQQAIAADGRYDEALRRVEASAGLAPGECGALAESVREAVAHRLTMPDAAPC